MPLLIQFFCRLVFGATLAMALTNSKTISSGYYRNNLYVLVGLNVGLSLIVWTGTSQCALPLWLPVAAAVACYLGAVCWFYEKPQPAVVLLALIAALTLAGSWVTSTPAETANLIARVLTLCDAPMGGLLLGLTFDAMLLGHWYLNQPGMTLAPLKRLVLAMLIAVVTRAALASLGLVLEASEHDFDLGRGLLVALRWLAGLIGGAAVALAAWQTLKVPNTQSATGILYVGVIGTFLGELTSLLLSTESTYPL
jgi:hypothetical protein